MNKSVPDSGIQPCPCGARYESDNPLSVIRLVGEQRIGGKDTPARGVLITPAYVYCKKCETRAAKAASLEAAISNWNSMLGG